jgi:hypothetical protein
MTWTPSVVEYKSEYVWWSGETTATEIQNGVDLHGKGSNLKTWHLQHDQKHTDVRNYVNKMWRSDFRIFVPFARQYALISLQLKFRDNFNGNNKKRKISH